MQTSVIKRNDSSYFSAISNDLTYHQDYFHDFIQRPFSLENIAAQIHLKEVNYPQKHREILVETLAKSYKQIEATDLIKSNLVALKERTTYTITTGHQLCLFTGPLYFIYKILHTIKLSEALNEKYPTNRFVPVYWMASEDHDFEEINHFYLFNQKITWETEQNGAVGEFNLDGLDEVKTKLQELFQRAKSKKINNLINLFDGKNLAEATFKLVNELFKNYGLIIVDGNQKALKELFIPVIKKEIVSSFSNTCVEQTNVLLEQKGIKPQVFSRPVNLFYNTLQQRSRIIRENEQFKIDGLGTFTEKELLAEVDLHTERFSPNVILRPLYQETILPNLAYIGGGGEIAYWLQFKKTFDEVQLTYPLIQVRVSLQLMDANAQKKAEKLGLKIEELLMPVDDLKNLFIKRTNTNPLDFSKVEQLSEQLKMELAKLIIEADSTLSSFAEAEKTKLTNQLEAIKAKINRQIKSKFDVSLKQIDDLKQKLFPQNGLQERHDNFLNFCPDGDYEAFIQSVYSQIDPFEKELILLKVGSKN